MTYLIGQEIDDFSEANLDKRGSGNYLENWKNKDADHSRIDLWLHPKGKVTVAFRHAFSRVSDGEKGKKIFMFRWNSMEDAEVLNAQNFVHSDGTREKPAVIDPFGRMLDFVAEQVADDKIGWTDPVFLFDIGSKRDNLELYAGGILGQFNSKHLSREDEDKIYQDTGVKKSLAFQQDLRAKESYFFQVIPVSEPTKCVIAIDGKTLALKFQKCVQERKEKYGAKGDPYRTPCAFRWNYYSKLSFRDKYTVIDLPEEPLTDEVKETMADPPADTSELRELSNLGELRHLFETHWCHKVRPDWDEIFGDAVEFVKQKLGADAAKYLERRDDFNHGANDRPRDSSPDRDAPAPTEGTVSRTRGNIKTRDERKPEPAPREETKPEPTKSQDETKLVGGSEPDDEDQIACDICDVDMSLTDLACRQCGAEYNDDGIKHKSVADGGDWDLVDGKYVQVKNKPEAVPGARKVARRRSDART